MNSYTRPLAVSLTLAILPNSLFAQSNAPANPGAGSIFSLIAIAASLFIVVTQAREYAKDKRKVHLAAAVLGTIAASFSAVAIAVHH